MRMKLWGGRFNKETDKLVEIFNASLKFDKRLYHYDIMGSIAHVKMLARTSIITQDEAEKIVRGLKEIEIDIKQGKIEFNIALEDIHMLIEKNLIDRIGEAGGKLHTARSRNDQIALDIRLYLRDEIYVLQNLLINFLELILELAGKYKGIIMPGYTHLQRAQPISFAHHLLAYYFKLKRDYERWEDNLKRVNVFPLGSGALAGTTFPIDREWVAKELGFPQVSQNSIDGVSDRDFIIEFLSDSSILMMHLSRFSEELIMWASKEFSFIEMDDAYATGSSIMPQKKNPDVAELVRGKTGRIYGNLMQLLTTFKGLPLAYNKDMQEDKEGLFDTIDTLKIILNIFPDMLKTMKINVDTMFNAAREGFVNATDLADYLAKKGLPFRMAHELVGKAVIYALKEGKELAEISLDKWIKEFPDLKDYLDEDLYMALDIKKCVEKREVIGGPSASNTNRVIRDESSWIKGVKTKK
jgi:argininosuccinate lyase